MTVRSNAASLRLALARAAKRLRHLRQDSRGAIAVWLGIGIIPLTILVFGLVDVSRMSLDKRRLQDALDAATLMAARTNLTDPTKLKTAGVEALKAQLPEVSARLVDADFTLGENGRVIGSAGMTFDPVILNVFKSDMAVKARSEVVRSATNLEVALVLDITGSMRGQRLVDLKTAANDLVDVLVRENQTDTDPQNGLPYSKMAIVPYAMGVNVGGYADAVRGAVLQAGLSSAAWNNANRTITSYQSGKTPVFTTSASHGFAVGDYLYFASSNATLNGQISQVTAVNATQFRVTFANSITSGSSGTVYRCINSSCTVVVTAASTGHNFRTGDELKLTGVTGLTALNNLTPIVTAVSGAQLTTDLQAKDFVTATAGSGGAAACQSTWRSDISCANLNFINANNNSRTLPLSTCVSERTGGDAYTDTAPGSALVGRNYVSSNPCPTSTITPLTWNRKTLTDQINGLEEDGSTAGQIGLAWGWYMVSPEFGYLWPDQRQRPAAYDAKKMLKIVVLMTDGAFNTNYCNGVIAKNAGAGSGSNDDHINCNGTNGSAFDQAAKLCEAMKKKQNLVIYTVGFTVGDDATAKSVLTNCASSPKHARFPDTGGQLKDTFKDIAREISSLRIDK